MSALLPVRAGVRLQRLFGDLQRVRPCGPPCPTSERPLSASASPGSACHGSSVVLGGGGEGGAHVTGAPGTGQEAEVEVGGLGNNHRFGA